MKTSLKKNVDLSGLILLNDIKRNHMDIQTIEKMISSLRKALTEEIEFFDNLKKEHPLYPDWVEFCENEKNYVKTALAQRIEYYTKELDRHNPPAPSVRGS